MPRRIVTLTTDFGWRDSYVAAMKGVLLSRCPDAHLVDLTHDIGPQRIMEAGLFLSGAAPWFPPETIHLVIVDPGVGGERHPMAALAGGQYFVGPDNGFLSHLLQRFPLERAVTLNNPTRHLPSVSDTFHGRDIFAPAAAHLARGGVLEDLGTELDVLETLPLKAPEPLPGGGARGEIVHIDRFGNCISNIGPEHGMGACMAVVDKHALRVARTYAAVPRSSAVALFGSSGWLEIAVRDGSAAAALGIAVGAVVELRPA
jgi:S-adenosylmethionine hydrolase